MAQENYDLVFRGELVRGAELAQAKRNIAQLFKVDNTKVESLFSGKAIVLKKGLDFATANKYRVAIKKAGCRVDVLEQHIRLPSGPEAAHASTAESVPAAPAPEPNADSTSSAESLLSLAPGGGNLLSADEVQPTLQVDVDTSGLSVKEAGDDLLNDSEKIPFVERDIALNAQLAPVGEALLRESEREKIDDVAVDLSGLSIAEAGERIEVLRDEKPSIHPDISHLKIVDG